MVLCGLGVVYILLESMQLCSLSTLFPLDAVGGPLGGWRDTST